ncbi:MAG: AraC family transcriptional regulator [Cyanobacteria bacterium P01_D01_bin.56]
MTFSLSHHEYWDLVNESRLQTHATSQNSFETVFAYPEQLGRGIYREIKLRDNIVLAILDYRPHANVEVTLPERWHSIEYDFWFTNRGRHPHAISAGEYFIKGSGIAPAETNKDQADKSTLCINVHIPPAILQAFLGESSDLDSSGLSHLLRPAEQLCYYRKASTTIAMHTVVHQLVTCPFEGITKKVYLESKVWELMSLLINEELRRQDLERSPSPLTADVIERIHSAREILLQQLDTPPSLPNLARQAQLNECTLKRGFRQVFGETAFSCLHNHRMERARQLLIAGEVNVSEAARKVGIANRGHFAAAFRKKYGVSPSEYLRQRKNSG